MIAFFNDKEEVFFTTVSLSTLRMKRIAMPPKKSGNEPDVIVTNAHKNWNTLEAITRYVSSSVPRRHPDRCESCLNQIIIQNKLTYDHREITELKHQ